MLNRKTLGVKFHHLLVLSALWFSQVGAQPLACSDSFSVANVGVGKTWQILALDKSNEGAATVADGQLTLVGRGADIYGARNEFVTAYRGDIEGDFDVSVKLVSQDSVHEWSQAGIVVANDLTDLTKGGYAAVDISPMNGYTVFYDRAAPAGQLDGNSGAGKTVYPAWLRFAKAGTQYTAWYKTQATGTWNQLPKPPVSLNTAAKVQIGLFTVSHSTTKSGKAVFDDFTCLHAQTTSILPQRNAKKRSANNVFPFRAFLDATGRAKATMVQRPF
jgi:regulation of enolase protein 1 (concanavalin A-like superfamily)